MPNLLIVTHTPTENSQALTNAVVRGARHPEISCIELRLKPALESTGDDVLWADALLLGTTENFGYMSGGLKDFFDRIYYPCLEKTEALPYALFIRAGIDGQGARTSVERIVTGLRWKQVQETLICVGDFRQAFVDACEEFGATMAAGLEAGIY